MSASTSLSSTLLKAHVDDAVLIEFVFLWDWTLVNFQVSVANIFKRKDTKIYFLFHLSSLTELVTVYIMADFPVCNVMVNLCNIKFYA